MAWSRKGTIIAGVGAAVAGAAAALFWRRRGRHSVLAPPRRG